VAVEIVAEVASNHGGSMACAKEFIHAFAPHVDTIKFQLTRVAHLRPTDPQFSWFQQAELTLDQFAELKRECNKAGVSFLLTVYNAADVWEVVELGCWRVKIGSGETSEASLREEVQERRLYPVVSYGLDQMPTACWGRHAALGCVTRYPAPEGIAAARMMGLGYNGWSDHAVGLNELKAAIACGATMVETHVCLPGQYRPVSSWEKTVGNMQELKAFAREDPRRFLKRWQAS
jgi:sialic acid synthase SpsE